VTELYLFTFHYQNISRVIFHVLDTRKVFIHLKVLRIAHPG